jgi:CheY-like chemotaxis protein
MKQRVFVKVTGFSDVERHALNTVFRLSEDQEVAYSLWTPEAPEAPQVSLIDGQSYEGGVALTSPLDAAGPRMIWVGAVAPAHAWRTFTRPLRWTDIVKVMNDEFAPPPALDLDLGEVPALDLDLSAFTNSVQPGYDRRHALIVAIDPEIRLYLRAKMAAQGLTLAQEALTVEEALEFAGAQTFQVILLDMDITGQPDWQLYKALRLHQPRSDILVMSTRADFTMRLRARFAGARACLRKPLHPLELHDALKPR